MIGERISKDLKLFHNIKRLPTMTKARIGKPSDIPDDKPLKVDVFDQKVLVAKVDGQYCAIANKCPHMGLPMAKGNLEDGVLTCPYHGSKFEMCSGKNVEWVETFVGIPLPGFAQKLVSMGKTSTDVASFEVTEEDDVVYIDI